MTKSIDEFIRKNLGERTLEKIENRLSTKYGLTLVEAMSQSEKLNFVLHEFFGDGADGLERRFMQSP